METITTILAITIAAAPALAVSVLGVALLMGRPLSEQATCRVVLSAIAIGLVAAAGMWGAMLVGGEAHRAVSLGRWIDVPGFHFTLKLLFDWLSMSFLVLSLVLSATIARFAQHYLHREAGFHRFFVLFAIFTLGMVVTSLAGNVETLFVGWELVGVSSALLVAFFHERLAPVQNGLRVWSVYRISDAALVTAAVVLHGMHGQGDFDALFGAGAWPEPAANIPAHQALVVGLLLAIAAAGKSALIPFSGWLPRAMEGPTPSSAIFYGALSVHLGAFLLLRVSPLIQCSAALCAILVVWGLATAALAALAARVQSDIKTALSFASLVQVGFIVAEIGLGLRWIPLLHMIGHASLRTLQFVRAPNLLLDYRAMENALGGRLPQIAPPETRLPASVRRWIYHTAIARGHFDSLLSRFVVRPVLAIFRKCDRLERGWTDWLSQAPSRESDQVKPHRDLAEELL